MPRSDDLTPAMVRALLVAFQPTAWRFPVAPNTWKAIRDRGLVDGSTPTPRRYVMGRWVGSRITPAGATILLAGASDLGLTPWEVLQLHVRLMGPAFRVAYLQAHPSAAVFLRVASDDHMTRYCRVYGAAPSTTTGDGHGSHA